MAACQNWSAGPRLMSVSGVFEGFFLGCPGETGNGVSRSIRAASLRPMKSVTDAPAKKPKDPNMKGFNRTSG